MDEVCPQGWGRLGVFPQLEVRLGRSWNILRGHHPGSGETARCFIAASGQAGGGKRRTCWEGLERFPQQKEEETAPLRSRGVLPWRGGRVRPCTESQVVAHRILRFQLLEALGAHGAERRRRDLCDRDQRYRGKTEREGDQDTHGSKRQAWRESQSGKNEKRRTKKKTGQARRRWGPQREVESPQRRNDARQRGHKEYDDRPHRRGWHGRGDRGRRDGRGRSRERLRPWGPLKGANYASGSDGWIGLRGEDREEEEKKGEESKSRRRKRERSCSTAAGPGRAAKSGKSGGEREEEREEEEEEEEGRCRQELAEGTDKGLVRERERQVKGKAATKKEEQERRRSWGVREQQQRLRDGELFVRGLPGSPSEEVESSSRRSLADACEAREGDHGSELCGGHRGQFDPDYRGEDAELLPLDDPPVPQSSQSRHEGASSFSGGIGRAEERRAGEARRHLSITLPGYPHSSERGILEERPISRTSSFGDAAGGPYELASRGKEAWQDGAEKPRRGRRLEEEKRRKLEPKWERTGEQRKRKRQRKGLLQVLSARRRLEPGRRKLAKKQEKLVERPEREDGCSRQARRQEAGETNVEKEKRGEVRPKDYGLRKGYEEFLRVVEEGHSLKAIGCLLTWLVVQGCNTLCVSDPLVPATLVMGMKDAGTRAVHRSPKREIFPIRAGELQPLLLMLGTLSCAEILQPQFVSRWAEDSWTLLSVLFVNSLHGCRQIPEGRWRKVEATAVSTMRAAVQRTLSQDTLVNRSLQATEKELSARFVSYTGEEVPKMEPLTLSQILPALPPQEHGGSIAVTDWTSGFTRSFLLHPENSVVEDVGQKLPKLQAKVHIVEDDRLRVAETLVKRNICCWVESEKVQRFRGERVLNGMFGVAKSALLDDGRPTLRVIMNLIPSNSIMMQLDGAVRDLPSVTQYLSVSLEAEESFRVCQNDMTSAFYLFSLPRAWAGYLAFNLETKGELISEAPGKRFNLACCVLPMGWSSAVSVMQEIGTKLLVDGGLPISSQVRRSKPLPRWLTEVVSECKGTNRSFWHVYLENFFSGERTDSKDREGSYAMELQLRAETSWNSAGVLSSEKKKVKDARSTQELGAQFDADTRSLGASSERLIKLIQTTSLVIAKERIPRKWLQVVVGRWVHVLQFRRCGMAALQSVWKVISGKRSFSSEVLKTRRELFDMMCGACLLHTHLGAQVSSIATASDASGKGGAVGRSDALTPEGHDFVRCLEQGDDQVPQIPVLVLSLFGGRLGVTIFSGWNPLG